MPETCEAQHRILAILVQTRYFQADFPGPVESDRKVPNMGAGEMASGAMTSLKSEGFQT